jgi:hypothetical protein
MSHTEVLQRVAVLEAKIVLIQSHAFVRASTNFSTHDFYLKKKIAQEWENLHKWIEV